MDLSGTWRAALADDDLRRGPSASITTTTVGSPFPSRGTGGRCPPSPPATGRSSTAPASSSIPDPPAPATGSCSTASSTRPTSSSTVPTWATPRATSSLTPTTSRTSPASARSTSWRSRWPHPTAGPAGQAQPHRDLPALGLHRPVLEPGRTVARSTHRAHGPVRINRLRALCRDADLARANVMVRAELDSDDARTVRVRTTLDGDVERELEHPLAKGTNSVEWTFGVDNPRLWWPRARRPAARPARGDRVRRPRAQPRPRSEPGCAKWRCTAGR